MLEKGGVAWISSTQRFCWVAWRCAARDDINFVRGVFVPVILFFRRYCQYQSTTTNRGLNLWLETVESPGSQRTAVILVSRVVTRLVCGFGELVFVMPQTFVPFTETRNNKTKWMNLLLVRVESPGSQRTAVILVSRGVTLLVCGFGELISVTPQTFVPCMETRNDKTKWMDLLPEKVESPGSQRTAVILVSRGATLSVCGFGQLVFVMPQNLCHSRKHGMIKPNG